MSSPIIAIVGRPNVGKSTLFNRLLGQRHAIVDSEAGITRDRIYADIEWCGHKLQLIDTGGYISTDVQDFNSAVREQAFVAIKEANLIIFMVDAKSGIIESDKEIAHIIRKSNKPQILVVNKCDNPKMDILEYQFHEFGFDILLPISALNGRLTGDLLDTITKSLKLSYDDYMENEKTDLKLAIVGMPNVGKSSLTNALLQKERTIVTPVAGTTRDSVDVDVKWHGKNITLVDTAGIRKLAKIKDRIEYYSFIRTKAAIRNSNIVLVLIDAITGFGKQDKTIVEDVIDNGKGLILVVNKWDMIEKNTSTADRFKKEISYQFKALENYPIVFISCLTKQRIHRIFELSWDVFQKSRVSIQTGKLNEALRTILKKNPPPSINGKTLKIKYATQVSCEPVVIALYANIVIGIKTSYKRYIENQLRQNFDMVGIPIRLSFRRK